MPDEKPPRKLTATLFLPVLNEIDGMRTVMPQIDRSWVDEILVVDGGSTDGTVEYCREQGLTVLAQEVPGYVGAWETAHAAAKGDIFIAFTPDGNSVADRIPALVAKMREGYDMVIVSRYLAGAKSEDDDVVTGFGNFLFTWTINVLFGGSYTDTLVAFRAFRTDLLPKYPPRFRRGGFEPLMAIRFAKEGFKVAEIPGDEPERIGGRRKMQPIWNGLGIIGLILNELFIDTPTPRAERRPQAA